MRGVTACVLACALGVLGAGTAHADLIEADLLSLGDGLLTQDTVTGLEWLDLTATTNLSVTDVQAGAGGWYGMGFTHATTSQVSDLFLHSAPGATLNALLPGATYTGALALRNLMGTLVNEYGGGYAADGPGGGQYHRPFYEARTDVSRGLLVSPDGAYDGAASETIGHFLVRSTVAVPEPTSLGLLGTGLGMAWLAVRRRRRRRSA